MNIWNYDICVWHPPTFDISPKFLCKRNYVLKMVPTNLLVWCLKICRFFLMASLKHWKMKHWLSSSNYFLVLLSPKHVTDSFMTTFKKRDNHKRYILVSMMYVMLTHVMQRESEGQCQYMYTKRQFGWEVNDYSNYIMVNVSYWMQLWS